jgi:CheY-like chemotaxis protein
VTARKAESGPNRVRSYVVERSFRPGEAVPESGIYKAIHARHRAPHQVLALAGTPFPACRYCGRAVRFRVEGATRKWDQPRTPAVLVADDEAEVASRLHEELVRAGYQVSLAANYEEALRRLEKEHYDAIIAELDLDAQRHGLELARTALRMRASPLVILSTCNPTVDSLRALLGMRIHYLVTKPIDVAELRSALSRLMMRRDATRLVSYETGPTV